MASAIHTNVRGGWLPWLLAGPAAVSRTGRRLTQAGVFTAATMARLRAEPVRSLDEAVQRAGLVSWIAENLCALHGIHVVARGEAPQGPAIVVANHLSYIDPLAVLSHLPAGVIAKREVGDWPVIGDVVRGLGGLLVDRACPHSGARTLRTAGRMLRRGGRILAFPEGTTTLGGEVLPFRRGLFGLAQIEGVPVIPVALRYESEAPCWVGDAAFLPHYVRTTARAHTHVMMQVGPPLDPRSADGPGALAAAARHAICEMLCLPPERTNGRPTS
jgi:lyso-ornithine lipid O-acyltransferase